MKQRQPADIPTFWAVSAVIVAGLPHALRLPPWITGAAGCLLLIRLALAWTGKPQPRNWLLWILALMASAGVLSAYGRVIGRDGGSALLILMLGIKAYEIRSDRDRFLLLFLSYFLVITNFLATESLPTALYMIFAVTFITSALVGLAVPAAMLPVGRRTRLAGTLLAVSLPLALVLFLLFPRLPGSLWTLPGDSRTGRTGFTDSIEPGDLSGLISSGEPAFRVVFEGVPPAPEQRYWRGLVLWETDGRRWTVGSVRMRSEPVVDGVRSSATYVVTLEPHDQRWLFGLDYPAAPPYLGDLAGDFTLLARDRVRSVVRYRLTSNVECRLPQLPMEQRIMGLRLASGFNPRTRELAASWRAGGAGDEAVLRQALSFIRDGGFRYTLAPPLLGRDSMDEFLFRTRAGFCEHYASALVWLMRAGGVPARLVVGYLGGEMNAIGDYMVVRQSDAHAWVEVWLHSRGWIRVDPTAFAFPDRLNGLDAILPGASSPFLSRLLGRGAVYQAWMGVRGVFDAVNDGWNQWVLSYGFFQQTSLLKRLGAGGWGSILSGLLLGVASILALILAWLALHLIRRRPRPDPVQRLYLELCRKLARIGLVRGAAEGPADFAVRVAAARPDLAGAVRRVTELYIGLRYGPGGGSGVIAELRRLVREFRPGRDAISNGSGTSSRFFHRSKS